MLIEYSLMSDAFTTACLIAQEKLQFYEKGGVIDILETHHKPNGRVIQTEAFRNTAYAVTELYFKLDSEGGISENSPRYNRQGIVASYGAKFGSTNYAKIAAGIAEDVKKGQLFRLYHIEEDGEAWDDALTLEFIKALDILRLLLGEDKLGKDQDSRQFVMFPFVPVANMLNDYKEEFMESFMEHHKNRLARYKFLKSSIIQSAPDKWPDVWDDVRWTDENLPTIEGPDGQVRTPKTAAAKVTPHEFHELMDFWGDTHLVDPHEKYKCLEKETFQKQVREIVECGNLFDKWIYVRVLFEKFIAAFLIVMNETHQKDHKHAKRLAGLRHMAKNLPPELIDYMTFDMERTPQEQAALFHPDVIPRRFQEDIVDQFRLGIQHEVVEIFRKKADEALGAYLKQHQDMSEETKTALKELYANIIKMMTDFPFATWNQLKTKKRRDKEARAAVNDSDKKTLNKVRKEDEKRAKQEKKAAAKKAKEEEEAKEKEKEKEKQGPQISPEVLEQLAVMSTVVATTVKAVLENAPQPAGQTGSENPNGQSGE